MVSPAAARKRLDIAFVAEVSDSRGEWVSVSSIGGLGNLEDADD